MIIVNKEKPIKLCHCRPGDTVKSFVTIGQNAPL